MIFGDDGVGASLVCSFWAANFGRSLEVRMFRFIFEVCCIKVAEAQRFGFNETLWLMAAGRATREALLSEAGFEKVLKLFCR